MGACLVLAAGCGSTYEGDPEALCPAVDDITGIARALGPGNRLDLDQVADRYRQLAHAYREAADELDDRSAAEDARHLAEVIEEAAQDLEAVDDPTITSTADVQSGALDEMGEIITSNLPIGLDDPAMDQIDAQCGADLGELSVRPKHHRAAD
jgi:hypothetical protein